MNLRLAIESSSTVGSVAILSGTETIHQVILAEGMRHGQELMPAVEKCLAAASTAINDLSAIVVSRGPGSYTGTRIGVMAAKALAYGAKLPLIGVSSLAALAYEARSMAPTIIPVQYARKDEVYCAVFSSDGNNVTRTKEDTATTPDEAALLATGGEMAIVGTGEGKYGDILKDKAASETIISSEIKAATAASVGIVSILLENEACDDGAINLQPLYLRRDNDPGPFGL